MLTLVSSERTLFESLDRLSRTAAPRPDVRTLLNRIGPTVVRAMRADRGFIRLFPRNEGGPTEDVGLTGFSGGAVAGIQEETITKPLLAGRCVRDGHTLLVPIILETRTIGFFWLDLYLSLRPFADADGRFLAGIGQALMSLARRKKLS